MIRIPLPDLILGHDVMTFGKYKGQTIDTIAEQDPGYLLWCLREAVIRLPEGSQRVLEENLQRIKDQRAMEEEAMADHFRSAFPHLDYDPFDDENPWVYP